MPKSIFAWAVVSFTLPLVFAFQADPQAVREQLDTPEFAKILDEILGAAKIGTIPQINAKTGVPEGPQLPAAFVGTTSQGPSGTKRPRFVLPAAGFCNMSELLYSCEWETKPNKYTVVVLQEIISERVAGAVPKTWTRESGEIYATRYTDFTDPSGEIVISVSCPISDDAPLPSWTTKLTIERADLRRLQLR